MRDRSRQIIQNTYSLSIHLVLLFMLISGIAAGQSIEGKVFDKGGTPIPFATIFVKELNRGLAANEKGSYDINVSPGTYSVKFQSIGYKPFTQVVTVGNKDVVLNVRLEEAVYDLAQVTVSNKDNPSIWIMRKAIALGQQYKRAVASYNADIYLKGSFNARKFSRVLRYMTPKSISVPKEGKTYFAEMLNKISFKAPDTYSQQVISFRSTLPGADSKDNFPGLEFMSTSIYDNSFGDIPSPLGLNAFSYYTYKLLGSSLDNNVPVYKIQVIPKRPSGKFFKGYLYISDNTYAVKNADLTFEMSFGWANFKLAFDLIDESAVLPTSYQLSADGGLLGSSGWVKSSGSIKYSSVSIFGRSGNRQAAAVAKSAQPTVSKKEAAPKTKKEKKREEKIEKLMDKTALSKGEMNELAKLMKQEEEAKTPDSLKTLERRGLDKVEFSQDFNQKDTSYWSEVRPIPLDEEEQAAFQQSDSIRSFKDRITALENLSRNGSQGSYMSFITGGYLYNNRGWEVKTKGFFNPNFSYFNPVDGFTVGNRMAIFKTYDDSRQIDIYLIPRYSFNRGALMGDGIVSYLFAPRKMGWLDGGFSVGSEDFNRYQPVQPLPNTVSSLFFKENFTKMVDVKGGYLGFSYELANGLTLGGRFSYERRGLLENSTSYSFFKQSSFYELNNPDNVYLTSHPLANHTQASVEARLTYTPQMYYRYDGSKKKYLESAYPTFELFYKRGVLTQSASQFTLLKLATWKRWDLGFLSELWYRVEGGSFFNSKQLQLPDFYFPNIDHLPVSFAPTKQSFHLLPYYKFATPGWFVEGHMLYEADNILIKQLPFFKGTVFTENLYLSYFSSRELKNYVEIGYGIDKIFVLMEVKAIVGFENGRYRSWGISISINRD